MTRYEGGAAQPVWVVNPANHRVVGGAASKVYILPFPRADSSLVIAAADATAEAKSQADYVCDGTADNVEINTAIASYRHLGGRIQLTEGAYQLASAITLDSNIHLCGSGFGTILRVADGQILNAVSAVDKVGVTVSSLKIDGNKANTPDSGGTQTQCGIIYNECEQSSIYNVWVTDVYDYGLHLYNGCSYCVIDACMADNTDMDGIGTYLNCSFCVISNCIGHDCTVNGVNLEDGSDCVVTGCTFYNCAEGIQVSGTETRSAVTGNVCNGNGNNGVYLNSPGSGNVIFGNNCNANAKNGIDVVCNDQTLNGNVCRGNTRTGINLYNSDRNTVSGNICENNGWHGIALDGCDYNIILGNQCNNNDSGDTSTYNGINLWDSDRNLVSNNICTGNNEYGINIGGPNCDNTKVNDNICLGNATGQINDAGTSTDADDNMVA